MKKYANNPTTASGAKMYTVKAEGYTYHKSIKLAKTKLGTTPTSVANKLIKKILSYYPYEWNAIRVNPHKTDIVDISFPIIRDNLIVNNDYPIFRFICKNGKITSMTYESKRYLLDCVVDRFIYDEFTLPEIMRKNNELHNLLTLAGIPVTGKVAVKMRYTSDYGKTYKEAVWEAESYQKLFDDYVTANDRLKYCNGSYYEFADPVANKAYRQFLDNYDGNYFLDNAVRRGCIID